MVGLRIEGTPEEIQEAIRRIQKVFSTNDPSDLYEVFRKKDVPDPELKWCYLRIYSYPGTDTLLEELEAAKNDVSELEIRLGEAHQKIQSLQEELGKLPKPKSNDVVLSPKHLADHSIPTQP